MVGFRDLVGTGIAPVSKKTAVKQNEANRKNFQDITIYILAIFKLHNPIVVPAS